MGRLIAAVLALAITICTSATALSRNARDILLSNSNYYLNFQDFAHLPNSTVMQGLLPALGPTWGTSGAGTVTTSGGFGVCQTSGVSCYLYTNLNQQPQCIVAEIAFTGGTDLTQQGMTIALSIDNPFSLSNLVHNNFGPQLYTLRLKFGASFIAILSGSWTNPMSNNSVVHKVMLCVVAATAMISLDNKEFHYVTDSRIPGLAGPGVFWEPALETDGLQTLISKAYTLANSGFVVPTPSSYAGPGDVKSGASAWWGLRAYSAATAGNRAANICNSGDANCADINTLANGNFDVTTAQGSPLNCGGTGGTCTVKILYDQSGANSCSSAACDLSQPTAATRPVLTFSCLGSLPCMTGSTATGAMQTGGTSSIAQPFTITAAAQRTGNFTAYNTIIANAGGSVGLYFNTTGNADFFVGGTDHAFAASNSAWHALQAIGSGTSSSGTTDGSTTAISAATTAFTSSAAIRAFNDTSAPGDAMVGTVGEFGVWSSAFSGTDLTNMNSNIHSYWGF